MKIKIIQRSKQGMWYDTHIGCTFQVVREESNCYWVRELDEFKALNFVYKEDCIITE